MKKYSTPAYIDNESGVTEFGSALAEETLVVAKEAMKL